MITEHIIIFIMSCVVLISIIPACIYIIKNKNNTISNFEHNYYSIMNKPSNHKTCYLLQGNRTDMLGSYSQGFVVTIITLLSKSCNNTNIIIDKTPKLFSDWSDYEIMEPEYMQDPNYKNFEHNKLLILGKESKESHKNARKVVVDILFPHKANTTTKTIIPINVKNTELQIKPGMLENENVKKFTKHVRNNFLKLLPFEFSKSDFIAIHYRAGDVLNSSSRFIHSSKYNNLCKYFKRVYPDYKIFVFTSKKPEPETDNLETFKNYAENIFEAQEYNTLQCWAIFMHCKIFVMSRSCMSVTTGLLRDTNNLTYYGTKERPLPDKNWKHWSFI